jgi:exosortase/archaeosortase
LLILPLGNLWLFYAVFTPITIYPVYWVLHWIYNSQLLIGNVIFIKGYYAEIIGACVAGAAYYFLMILNLSTPMHIVKRIKSLIFMFGTFLILNILRIIIFTRLFSVGYQYFDLTHAVTWYFGSTVLVVLVWFVNVIIFKIDEIPIYTDISALLKAARGNN